MTDDLARLRRQVRLSTYLAPVVIAAGVAAMAGIILAVAHIIH